MKLSFKKRIALFNTTAVAITTAIVFIVIYSVVYFSSYRHLDNDILLEKEEILNTLDWRADSIIINKMPEWEEAEHNKIEVNPTFIQIVDSKERMIYKSSNLQSNHFLYDPSNAKGSFYNTLIDNQRLRIGQFPIKNDQEKIIGQLTVGISQQESYYVLSNLFFTLCICFPALLLILYYVIYLTASKAISPVHQLIRTASGISDANINTRLTLPNNEDEIYQLAATINELLNRIENSIEQQKQFTADASHEIRTPLSAIMGTLEILLRKEREPEQYRTKIKEVLIQTDRLNQLLDQLLQLARLESGSVKNEIVSLDKLIHDTKIKCEKEIIENNIQLKVAVPSGRIVNGDMLFLSIILENLLRNAIKYGDKQGVITLLWNDAKKTLSVTNNGPSIPAEQIPLLFNRFYRVDNSRNSDIAGSGLGLAIVKKLSDLQHILVSVSSTTEATTFTLKFSG
jgi:two-component system, OmpR family, heavy metal sensor histidine kinase CusS